MTDKEKIEALEAKVKRMTNLLESAMHYVIPAAARSSASEGILDSIKAELNRKV